MACFTLDRAPPDTLDAGGRLGAPFDVATDPLARAWIADAGHDPWYA